MLSYTQRSTLCQSSLAKQLLLLMDEKKTNLAFSADVTSGKQLLALANQLGPEICLLKTHIDIVRDFTPTLINKLSKLAERHRFLIFEDRKFADIGHTVKHQYEGGLYRIADWAHFVTAHSVPGPDTIKGLAEVGLPKQRGLILLAEMSSAGHLMSEDYTLQTLAMARKYPEFVIGFITQHAVSVDPQWIHFTPGVRLTTESDTLGQRYISPETAILNYGSDVIIVGRGIIEADDPLAEAKKYRESGWEAYWKKLTTRRLSFRGPSTESSIITFID